MVYESVYLGFAGVSRLRLRSETGSVVYSMNNWREQPGLEKQKFYLSSPGLLYGGLLNK